MLKLCHCLYSYSSCFLHKLKLYCFQLTDSVSTKVSDKKRFLWHNSCPPLSVLGFKGAGSWEIDFCICSNSQMYLSKLTNIFVFNISKYIYQNRKKFVTSVCFMAQQSSNFNRRVWSGLVDSIAVSIFVVFWFILTNTESETSRRVW